MTDPPISIPVFWISLEVPSNIATRKSVYQKTLSQI